MSELETIQQQLQENRVVLYMKGTPDFPQCGYSANAVNILKQCKVNFFSVNVLVDPAIREGIKQYGAWPTIPQLYVDGKLIGGSDILSTLFDNGELQEMLSSS